MNSNERILSQVLAERSGHARFAGVRSPWLVLGLVLLGLAAAALTLRAVTERGAGTQVAIDSRQPVQAARTSAPVGSTTPAPAARPTEASLAAAAETADRGAARYVVQAGDSLDSIAERNGLRPATLASINELEDPELLQPGRELVVPASDGFVHVVQHGETLRALSERYHVDVAILATVNSLSDPDHVEEGFHLFIPDPAL
jgi:LysM repeat protein